MQFKFKGLVCTLELADITCSYLPVTRSRWTARRNLKPEIKGYPWFLGSEQITNSKIGRDSSDELEARTADSFDETGSGKLCKERVAFTKDMEKAQAASVIFEE